MLKINLFVSNESVRGSFLLSVYVHLALLFQILHKMAEGPQVTERLPVPPSGDSAEKMPLPAADSSKKKHLPTCIIVLGMAGSGKTTFVQRLTAELYRSKTSQPYVVNLDPACREVPYPANIDIRDTVNYKQVMKQYQLGPNGGIVTSLNLFATKFDQVRAFFSRRNTAPSLCEHILELAMVNTKYSIGGFDRIRIPSGPWIHIRIEDGKMATAIKSLMY